MNRKQLEQFAKLLNDAVTGVRPPERGETLFTPNFRTHNKVSYWAPEESDRSIQKVVLGFEKKFGDKYTLDEIHRDVRELFAVKLKEPDHDLMNDLDGLAKKYDSYNTQQVLVRRIRGVELSQCSFKFGRVLLVPIGEQLNSIVTELTEKIFSEGKLSKEEREEQKKRFLDIVSDEFEGVTGKFQINDSVACVAEYTATPARALERSQEEIEFIIDLLRYFGVATQSRDVHVDFSEAYPSKNSVAFVTSGRAVSLQPTAGKDDHATVRLGLDAMDDLHYWGVFQLADYSDSGEQHDLKKAIARAVHWFSLAARQQDKANKILLYITALESLFPSYGREKVSDCCAFLLGVDAESRMQIAELIKEFYSQRNPIAHGGSADRVEGYRSLRRLVLHAIWASLQQTEEHKSPRNLAQSFDELKFSFPSDVK